MSNVERFNPARLTFARKHRGLTKTKLASMIGVEMRSVSGYENGEYNPDGDKLQEIAKTLKFPLDFFSGDDLEELSPDSASFRALSKKTARQRDMALGAGAIALLVNEWIEERFQLPQANLPDLSREGDPEAASETMRSFWGLGELPIKSIVHLLESKGVRIFSLSVDADEIDAFSMWRENTPFIFLNTRKSAEHSRFDAAHELGHLAMHRHGAPQGQDAEREANKFASSFLMPRASVLANAPPLATVNQLIKLKKVWNVSVAALIYRLHMVEVLSDWHYRTLFKQIAPFRKQEPEEAQRETSQLFEKVFRALREEGISKGVIADDLHVHREEIEQLVFGLTIMGLTGTATSERSLNRKGPHLRDVSSDS